MKKKIQVNLLTGFLIVFITMFLIIVAFALISFWGIRHNPEYNLWLSCVIVGGVLLILAVVFAIVFVFLPIGRLRDAVRRLDAINPESSMDLWASAETVADSMNTLLDELRQSMEREHAEVVLRQQSKYAELQNQINPHFLYNTLETIRGQAIVDDHYIIADMTEALAKYFRYNISKDNDVVTLEQELENIRNYIQIQTYRFQDRFDFHIYPHCEREEYAFCQIPKMTLQPIVENAIFHGMERKVEKGHISIHIDVTPKRLVLLVADDGMGMEEQRLHQLNERLKNANGVSEILEASDHNGIAMENVNSRLRLLYGAHYGLRVSSTIGLGTEVEITLPRVNGEENN